MTASLSRYRVLHIGKYLPPVPGGMESYLGDLLRLSAGRGIVAGALVHQKPTYATPNPKDFGGAYVAAVKTLGQWLYVPLAPTFGRGLKRAIRDFQPNVLHIHLPNMAAFVALFAAEARRLPWVIHWHADVAPEALPAWGRVVLPVYRLLEKMLLRKARWIIATSQPYLESSSSLQPFREKTAVLPLFIDPSRLTAGMTPAAITLELESPRNPLRILAVGRLTYYKGFDVLLRALVGTDEGVTLTLVGEGDQAARLKALSASLGLNERVRFLGAATQAELIAEYADTDLFCLPSIDRSEAFGLVLLEASMFGAAIIASNVHGSGLPWLATQLGGTITPAGNSVVLAEAINRFRCQQRTPATRADTRLRAEALSKKWMENSVTCLAQVYNECLLEPDHHV
jgi:glycosyltransferase involved in cell wall biosynthesis